MLAIIYYFSIWRPLKIMESVFYFIWISIFVLKIFIVLIFFSLEKPSCQHSSGMVRLIFLSWFFLHIFYDFILLVQIFLKLKIMSDTHHKDLFLFLMTMFRTKIRKLCCNETSDNETFKGNETLSTNRLFFRNILIKKG